MKILFLSAANSIHTVKWVNALANRGHEVYLIYNKGHEPKQDAISMKVKLYQLKYDGSKAYYLNAGQLRKITKEIAPEMINVHYASGYGTLARMARIGPILLSIWGSDVYEFPYQSKLKKKILKKNIKYAEHLASTSYCMARQLKKVLNNEELQLAITPFGVDLNLFDSAKYQKKEDGLIWIGNIKTLEKKYGIAELIHACNRMIGLLKQEGKIDIARKIRLCIYGEGSQKEELLQLVKTLNMDEIVSFKGRIANSKVPQALKNLAVFCAVSNSESFGVSAVEAMAMEIPVVTSDADGFKEVVVDCETGLIVPRGNIEEIALALKTLVLDGEKRRLYGENGKKRVESLYDWEKNVDTMENLYNCCNMKG